MGVGLVLGARESHWAFLSRNEAGCAGDLTPTSRWLHHHRQWTLPHCADQHTSPDLLPDSIPFKKDLAAPRVGADSIWGPGRYGVLTGSHSGTCWGNGELHPNSPLPCKPTPRKESWCCLHRNLEEPLALGPHDQGLPGPPVCTLGFQTSASVLVTLTVARALFLPSYCWSQLPYHQVSTVST